MAQVEDPDQIWPRRKAAIAIFPYAIWKEQSGEHRMINAFFDTARALSPSSFMWGPIKPFITMLFDEASHNHLDRAIILLSPYILHEKWGCSESMITRWATATLSIPYTEEIGQIVVDTLLRIASINSLQPHIPISSWALLNKRPSLPRGCSGRYRGTEGDVVCGVRALGDIEILKSYLLLVWSEWDIVRPGGLTEMCASIREDFSGVGMGCHREDLLRQLDHVLGQLNLGPGYPLQYTSLIWYPHFRSEKRCYEKLKEVVLEVEDKATEILTRMLSRFAVSSITLTQ